MYIGYEQRASNLWRGFLLPPPVLVHHPLHRAFYDGNTSVVWSSFARLLFASNTADGRTPRRFPRHARYSSRTTKREPTERPTERGSHARTWQPADHYRDGRTDGGATIHPCGHRRSLPAARRPLSRRFQTCQTIIRHRTHALSSLSGARRPGASNWRGEVQYAT